MIEQLRRWTRRCVPVSLQLAAIAGTAAATVLAGSPAAIGAIGAVEAASPAAPAQAPRPDQLAFREIFRELIETDTSHSIGSCTAAAEKMAVHLRAAGFPESDIHLFAVAEHPKDGGLVAVLPGTDRGLKALLLLAHLDVVEARREDWTRDPFKLIEEGGYFYGRGTFDDKSMDAVWVDTLIRLRKAGYKPRRTIKMALTCGEEAGAAFSGAEYLVKHEPQLIDAAFALNEFAYGVLDAQGHRVVMEVEAGEKTDQNYRLEVVNPGGHSSRPVKNNAIYHLAAGLTRLSDYEFPVQMNDTTRFYFSRMSTIVGGETGAAMKALVNDPTDVKAAEALSEDPRLNAMLRTTCVATLVNAGHASNALPQRARHRQLPHLSRGCRRGGASNADHDHGGPANFRDDRRAARSGSGAAAADGRGYEAHRAGHPSDLSGHRRGAGAAGRGYGRDLSGRGGHTDLRRQRHVHRSRSQQCSRTE
jgi:acetylornithine deacetylase/succinyl-diaminopimelate desuccinylase-like protein